jgi:CarD family transcriptional regulator
LVLFLDPAQDFQPMGGASMDYTVGDTVVHWTHGLGKVVAIEEMDVAGDLQEFYVVEVDLLKLWVPVEEKTQNSIRPPAASPQFLDLLAILRSPAEKLPDNHYKRKIAIRERLQQRTLADLCCLIRDLVERARHHSLNVNDAAVLYRAEEFLLDEWVFSLGVERAAAQDALEQLLRGERPNDGSRTPEAS